MGSSKMNDRKHEEAVIKDNEFHRTLSGYRNQQSMQNHPDIDLMVREQQQKLRQRHLETLVGMAALKPGDLEKPAQPDWVQGNLGLIVNLKYAMQQLQRETKRSQKFGRPLSVAVIGFPQLDGVARQYAEYARDFAQEQVAALLVGLVDHEIDIVGQLSQDKYLVILPETDGVAATNISEQIRQTYSVFEIQYRQYKFCLSTSIGLACVPQHGFNCQELIAKADIAADMITERGGNAFAFGPI